MKPKKLARKVLPKSSIKLAEESYRRGRRVLTHARYLFPARNARVIAVTGTNGKTTICMMINTILKTAGFKTALFTTAVVEVAGRSEPNLRHTTVPLTADLLNFFRRAKKAEVDFVILETTSHALHQHKLRGIPIEVAVITNLTQEHLDYHGTMKNYATAKARLFNNYMNPTFCVLNGDDEWFNYFYKQAVGSRIVYGQKSGVDVSLSNVVSSKTGSDFTFSIDGKKLKCHINLAGQFNAVNAAAAVAATSAIGITADKAIKGLAKLQSVPGRLEAIEAGQKFNVFVDYAVTPDSLDKALRALKSITHGKVSVVFGATGDRDKAKRPIMGEVAAKLADKIFLTDDETYSEDSKQILDEVYAGIKKAKGSAKTKVIADRKLAIQYALKQAKPGEGVLITGMGHQITRNMGGKEIPWDERKVVKNLLKNLK